MDRSGEVTNMAAELLPPIVALPGRGGREAVGSADLGALRAPLQVARLANIDLLRIIAAAGIVWFHMAGIPHRRIAHAGLPIFLLVFYSLIARQEPTRALGDFVKMRAERLLKPWLFWSVVYGLCRLAKSAYGMNFSEFGQMGVGETLLCGTNIHLWYLPFAFVSGCLVYQIHRWLSGFGAAAVAGTAAALGLLALIACEVTGIGDRLPRPLPQWTFALASIPLGLAIGRCMAVPDRRTQRRLLTVICLAVVTACGVLYWQGFAASAVPYALAVVLVCLACAWPGTGHAFVAAVAPLTFGIYLIHPLVVYGLKVLVAPDQHYVAFVALTVCLSGLTTWVLTQTPLRRFV